jgi:hypothetical protein
LQYRFYRFYRVQHNNIQRPSGHSYTNFNDILVKGDFSKRVLKNVRFQILSANEDNRVSTTEKFRSEKSTETFDDNSTEVSFI